MSDFNIDSSILPFEIISIFNDYYQLYLNGLDIHIIIDLYITKNLYYIYKKELKYKLLNSSTLVNSDINSDINLYYNLEFNKVNLGYLYIELPEQLDQSYLINLTNLINLINLFISYLSIFVYNSKFINRPNVINCSIFTEVLNMMNEGVMILDNNFIVLFLNKTSEVILNKIKSPEEHTNKKIFDLFSQLEDVLEYNQIYKNKKINYKINKNNTDFNFILNINTIIHNKLYYNIITININLLNIKKSDNIGFLSHELRNPLQAIFFANQLIQMKITHSVTDTIINNYKRYLDIIDKSVYDMIKIINDILDIDRINSNQINLSINNINLNELVQDIQFNFQKYLIGLNIKFEIILSDNLPKTLYSDSTRIKQIILNILNNSVKYSKINELNTISLNISYSSNMKFIDFCIQDTGIGIKKENLVDLMELKPIISNNKHNSNGFGLYLCNKLAMLLGGMIKINSEYTKGTSFLFSHPIKLGFDNFNIQKTIEKFNIFTKILIIDNNENITLLFKDILHNLKFKYNIHDEFVIDCCNNGSLVCDMVKLNTYDIIFMDLFISDINGITLVQLLRKQYFNKKIIGTSSDINYNINNTLLYENEKIFRLFDDIIIKPFDENDILDKLKY